MLRLGRGDARVLPWKNGRGTTTELALWPADARFERGEFDWRLSIAPVDDALTAATATSNTALNALDVFNARAALGEFQSAFDELDAEYNRLKSEDELAQHTTTLVQRSR